LPSSSTSVSANKDDLADGDVDDLNLTFREKISNSLGSYITIEAVWQVTLFAACYKYRPLVRLGRSERGQRILHKIQTTLFGTNNTPPKSLSSVGGTNELSSEVAVSSSLAKRLQSLGICSSSVVQRIPGGSRTLFAASEWFFFNKVIGIPLWPTKILLAGWITNKLQEHHLIQKRRTMRRSSTSSAEASVQCQQ
jgi:hypothetical protein